MDQTGAARPSPQDCPSSISLGSRLRIPPMVLMQTGNSDPIATRIRRGSSPIPNKRIINGISARCGMVRTI